MARNAAASKVESYSIPAPVGGLNARDAQANMPETDALVLDNWFCTPTDVEIRGGSSIYAFTAGSVNGTGHIESLMAYKSWTGGKLFAADTANAIYDVTSGGVASAAVSSLSNARFQHINFETGGGNYLYAVNGADDPLLYDGTNWTAINAGSVPAITGVTTNTFIHVNAYKSRLWFTPKNSTKIWYLPVNSIGGAAQSIDLGPLLRLGGYLMGMVTWTLNTANGTDEVAVFVSSEGEVVVFQGYDPSSASTWAQAGHFRIGRPIGRRFFCKAGADVVMITADGIIPLSQAMLTDRSQLRIALSDKIVNLIGNDVKNYNGNFGWQVILHPICTKLIVNVPKIEQSRQYQYVMNTITQAWSTFGFNNSASAWNANCFELFNDVLYFAGYHLDPIYEGVWKCDTGTADRGFSIVGYAKAAFSYFKRKGQQKFFTMARPILELVGTIQVAVSLNVDFDDTIPNVNYISVGAATSSPWDTSPWDTTGWGDSSSIIRDWQTVNGIGFAAGLSVSASTDEPLSWQSTDYVFQMGGIL